MIIVDGVENFSHIFRKYFRPPLNVLQDQEILFKFCKFYINIIQTLFSLTSLP